MQFQANSNLTLQSSLYLVQNNYMHNLELEKISSISENGFVSHNILLHVFYDFVSIMHMLNNFESVESV